MSEKISFPTQGELVSYAFNAFGIMPTKHDRGSRFDESAKRSLQKLLERLREEKGLLIENLDKAISIFEERFSQFLNDAVIRNGIVNAMSDLYRSYNDLIIKEGTYREKTDTLLYFLFSRAISTLVESVTFYSLRHRLFDDYGSVKEKLSLLLPDLSNGEQPAWPLGRVIRWVYEQAETSQRQFHLSGEAEEQGDTKYQRNLENAWNWTQGKTVPSLPALLANFSDSIESLDKSSKIPDDLVKSMSVMLILGRLSTAICKDIFEVYGVDVLRSLVGMLVHYIETIDDEAKEFKEEILRTHKFEDIRNIPDQQWGKACRHFFEFFINKKREARETLGKIQRASPKDPFNPTVIETLSQRLGVYPVVSCLDPILCAYFWRPDPEFFRLLNRGLEIKNRSHMAIEDIDAFEVDLKSSGMKDQLDWLPPWIRGIYFYRKERFSDALPYFENAFEQAKYKSGGYQYDLVNQYLEVCAKANQRRRFDAALKWANYAEIPIRWIRDIEQSKEATDGAFEMFKHVRYVL